MNTFLVKFLYLVILTAFATLFFVACNGEEAGEALTLQEENDEWHAERVETLKEDRGWLKLAGLYWLDDGEHSFGTDPESDIVLPEGSMIAHGGRIIVEGTDITLAPAEDGLFSISGEALTGSITFSSENPIEAEHGRLAFDFIERNGQIALRLYDQESYVYTGFRGIERFPADENFIVEATLIPHEEEITIPIINVVGMTEENDTPGILEFEIDGEKHSLWAISASEGERLFLIVADQTNRSTTFGGGRFLYVDNPGPNGTITVDFNKLYNPPCAFSDYTTCPLPPPENRLNVAIEAGEMRY
ncbi:MAG: DUF1684 domain-containing protein [Balneolia bacterium]|nr:DUF1684 domain-containing protein [Balneolia bacterium]